MHITGMTIEGVPPFIGRVEFEFDERVNLFVGPNASGKSTALRILVENVRFATSYSDPPVGGFNFTISVSSDWPTEYNVFPDAFDGENVPMWDALPIVSISATRHSLIAIRHPLIPNTMVSQPTRVDRQLTVLDGPPPFWMDFYGDDVDLVGIHFSTELRNTSINAELPRAKLVNFEKAMNISFSCARQICSEIILGERPLNFITNEGRLRTDLLAGPPDIRVGMAVDTADRSSLDVYSLSSGTQGILMWIRWLALKLASYHNFEDGWEKGPAILLIDEIENHLHPTWQRRVIPALLDHFSGLQIFATTHSPFVVAGLKKGQVHLLNRDPNGVVTYSPNTEDIVGWTADEILRTLMGVEDPTDDATAAAARELRQLRNDGPRDTEDAEAARQARMQELRRLVDRDLLAGGPAAAQRELFEQQFAEALEKYQQSRDLNQDSG